MKRALGEDHLTAIGKKQQENHSLGGTDLQLEKSVAWYKGKRVA